MAHGWMVFILFGSKFIECAFPQLSDHICAGVTQHVGDFLAGHAFLIGQDEQATPWFAQAVYFGPEVLGFLFFDDLRFHARVGSELVGQQFIAGQKRSIAFAQEGLNEVFTNSKNIGTQRTNERSQSTRLDVEHGDDHGVLKKVGQVVAVQFAVFLSPAQKLRPAIGVKSAGSSVWIGLELF